MAGLGDYQVALRMRDLIKILVTAGIDEQRPRLQYGTVTSIDRINRKCGILFPGASGSVNINMGAIQPSAVGQIVRIDGLNGDRFVSDVMGRPFIESVTSGMEREPVRTVSNTNITLSGLQTINSVALAAGDRILVRGQTTASNNGIYEVAVGTWVRASDANTYLKVRNGSRVAVLEGTFKNSVYTQKSDLASFSSTQDWMHFGWLNVEQFFVCTSSTRPTPAADENVGIYETDTLRYGFWIASAWVFGMAHDSLGLLTDVSTTSMFGKGFEQLRYMTRAQRVLRGGGVRLVTSTGVSWDHRFMVSGAGKGTNTATAGYHQIDMPTDGTVITRYAASGTATVASGSIPLAVWESLYYEIPLAATSTSQNANFRIVGHSGSSFDIPPNWILICARSDSSDTYCSEYTWGDGQQDDYWRTLTLQNSWSNYGAGYYTAEYRKVNGTVYVHGLIRLGTTTAGTVLTALPVGFRPSTGIIFPQIAGGNSIAAIEIEAGGNLKVRLCSNNGYMSIECLYQAEG